MEYNSNIKDILFQLTQKDLRNDKLLSLIYCMVKPLQELNSGQGYADYDNSKTYAVGNRVKYNRKYWVCKEAIGTPESFDQSKWITLGITDYFMDVVNKTDILLNYGANKLLLEKYLNKTYDAAISDFDEYDPVNDQYYFEGDLLTTSDNKPRIKVSNSDYETVYIYNRSESIQPYYFYNKWDSGESYATDDIIQHEGNIYQSKSAHSNQEPPNATYWDDLGTVTYYYNKGGSSSGYTYTIQVPTGLLGLQQTAFEADVNQWNYAGRTYLVVEY